MKRCSFLSMLLLITIPLLLASCSKNKDSTAENQTQKLLIGKWAIRSNNHKVFDASGKLVDEYNIHQEDSQMDDYIQFYESGIWGEYLTENGQVFNFVTPEYKIDKEITDHSLTGPQLIRTGYEDFESCIIIELSQTTLKLARNEAQTSLTGEPERDQVTLTYERIP